MTQGNKRVVTAAVAQESVYIVGTIVFVIVQGAANKIAKEPANKAAVEEFGASQAARKALRAAIFAIYRRCCPPQIHFAIDSSYYGFFLQSGEYGTRLAYNHRLSTNRSTCIAIAILLTPPAPLVVVVAVVLDAVVSVSDPRRPSIP